MNKIKKIKSLPGQESVWDYPRPPALQKVTKHIRIICSSEIILDTNSSFRILETSHPPTYYLPISDFKTDIILRNENKSSFCEFKGMAHYYDIKAGDKIVENCAWGYENPTNPYHELKDHVCVYSQYMDECYVGDEKVLPQPGGFYGGWITSNIVGPFKGEPGSWGW
ncbi:DUF427 domain-containing protein [Ekhidna sp.]